MRHGNKNKKFNRTSSHKNAMFANAALSLLHHEQIKTTLPKAKALRSVVEKLITFGKKGDLHARRIIISKIGNCEVAEKLLTVLKDRYATRNGGYTRVMKAGFRYGDNAPMAVIELVDRDVKAKGSKMKHEPELVKDEDESAE
jgi:large subunit ribosomal protein L17